MASFMVKIVSILTLIGVIFALQQYPKRISLNRVSACEICSGLGKDISCPNGQKFGQYCFREYTYTSGVWKTTLGTTDEGICRANALKSRLANPDCDLATPPDGTSCFDCCVSPLCHTLHSERCNARFPTDSSLVPDFMRQVRPTTTTNTTPKQTTRTTTTTNTKQGGLCQVCTDDGSSSCNSQQYVNCPDDKPYCMNDLIYDKSGRRQTIKRCTSELYCMWDWWIGTQHDQECNTSVSRNVTNNVCHYCCQTVHGESEPCNVDTIPKRLVSFRKPRKGKMCEVTDLVTGSIQTKECPDSSPFCMNDVFYDKSMASSGYVAQVNKRCVSEFICKGDWWIKSKTRPECLADDISSASRDNFLCHYCCLSDDKGPCNNETRPKQIYEFMDKTTASPPSFATSEKPVLIG